MSLPGLPEDVVAAFQAQKSWRKGRLSGQAAVAQFKRPNALSISLAVKVLPVAMDWRRASNVCRLSEGKSTIGPLGLTWNPNQVLTSDRTVLCQLRGHPRAARKSINFPVSSVAVSVLRSQQKSSTKTKPQSMCGNIK